MEKTRNNRATKRMKGKRNKRIGQPIREILMKNYKILYPISQAVKTTLSFSDTIQTVNGSPEVVFGSSGLYWNLNSIAGLTDFTEASTGFKFVKFVQIQVDIIRTADEASMFTNLRGGDIYLNYYPDSSSLPFSYADISRDINSYRIDVMTFDTQRILIKLPDYTVNFNSGGNLYWLNAIKNMIIGHVQYLNGEIAIKTANSINNTAALVLFKLLFKVRAIFSHRI